MINYSPCLLTFRHTGNFVSNQIYWKNIHSYKRINKLKEYSNSFIKSNIYLHQYQRIQFSSNSSNSNENSSLLFYKQKLIDYASLSKLRLSSLVVLTTSAGFVVAGSPIDYPLLINACVGTGLCAASAATFNQVIEVDRDKAMKRTKNRPLPAGRVGINEASIWGITTGVLGTSMLYVTTNPVVTFLGLSNIFLYAGPYTYSKQYSEINTWLGSIVGAIPPIMGFAAATGGVICTPEPLALGSLLFLWQFPHFFALSWLHREDYCRGDFQMVAVNDETGKRSAELIMEYSVYLSMIPLASSFVGLTSSMFAVEGTLINCYLLYLAQRFRKDQSKANARKIFLCSLWYLPLLLLAFVFHSRNWQKKIEAVEVDNVSILKDKY